MEDLLAVKVGRLDVLVLFDAPVLRQVRCTKLLALVHEKRATKSAKKRRQHLRGKFTMLRSVPSEPGDGSGLVVVLHEDSIPAANTMGKDLPLVDDLLKVGKLPVFPSTILSLGAIVDVDAIAALVLALALKQR